LLIPESGEAVAMRTSPKSKDRKEAIRTTSQSLFASRKKYNGCNEKHTIGEEVIQMDKKDMKTTANEYVELQRQRLERSRNARRWFYRGIFATLAGFYVVALVNKDDDTETEEA